MVKSVIGMCELSDKYSGSSPPKRNTPKLLASAVKVSGGSGGWVDSAIGDDAAFSVVFDGVDGGGGRRDAIHRRVFRTLQVVLLNFVLAGTRIDEEKAIIECML